MDYAAGKPAGTKPKSKLEQRASLLSTGHVKNSKRRRSRAPNSTKQVSLHPFRRFKLPHHPSCRYCISQCVYHIFPSCTQTPSDKTTASSTGTRPHAVGHQLLTPHSGAPATERENQNASPGRKARKGLKRQFAARTPLSPDSFTLNCAYVK